MLKWGQQRINESWDFAEMMDLTVNATCSAVNDENVKGKGNVQSTTDHKKFRNGSRDITRARWGTWLKPRPGRFTPGKDPVPIV
jgi:hypothetical protein